MRINGAKVGDHQLDPGQTDYDRSALYATYDVTQALAAGNNAVGVMLGNGRYAQDWGLTAFPELSHRLKAYDNAVPKLILQLELEFQDGTARTARTVVSDGSWKVAAGPIVANDIYNGETYDARRGHPGWDRPDYDDSTWQAADPVEAPRGGWSRKPACRRSSRSRPSSRRQSPPHSRAPTCTTLARTSPAGSG